MIFLEQIDKLKLKLGIQTTDTTQDDLLNLYLDDATEFILDETHLDVLPAKLMGAQVDLAVFAFNKQGIEGETAHSEGGINRAYAQDVPSSIMKKIYSCRVLPK